VADRIRVAVAPPRALVSIRGSTGCATHWIGRALGVAWRDEPLRLHQQDGLRWWSFAPDVWWVDAPGDQEDALVCALDGATPDGQAMVTVLSDAWVALHLEGATPALADLFERAGPVGAETLGGQCVATRFGPFAVVLFETGTKPAHQSDLAGGIRRIELWVERPLARSLEQWLVRLGATSGA
jgi:hypothetical protein